MLILPSEMVSFIILILSRNLASYFVSFFTGGSPNLKNEITITYEKNVQEKSETLKFISNNKTPNQTLKQSSITLQIVEVEKKEEKKKSNLSTSFQDKSNVYNEENLNFDQKNEKPLCEPPKNESSIKSIQDAIAPVDHVKVSSSNKNLAKNDSNISKEERKSTKKGTNTSIGLKVGPEIFVSLKKGSINQYYSIGKTLGEGLKLKKL